MWGYNISNTHPLKASFLLYKEMMEEVEDREEDEEEEERDDEGSGLFYVLVERRVPGHVMGCDAVNSTQCQHYGRLRFLEIGFKLISKKTWILLNRQVIIAVLRCNCNDQCYDAMCLRAHYSDAAR